MLVEQLGENDRVAIVVYAGASGLVLALHQCRRPGGRSCRRSSTCRPAARPTAARASSWPTTSATENFIKGGTNRVILCHRRRLQRRRHRPGRADRLIEAKAKSGVFLSVLGFGMGNLKDGDARKARRQGERQLRLHRHAERGPQGARRADGRHAGDDRQGRQDPGRVQPGPGRRPTA